MQFISVLFSGGREGINDSECCLFWGVYLFKHSFIKKHFCPVMCGCAFCAETTHTLHNATFGHRHVSISTDLNRLPRAVLCDIKVAFPPVSSSALSDGAVPSDPSTVQSITSVEKLSVRQCGVEIFTMRSHTHESS